jgi:hypothetical protein
MKRWGGELTAKKKAIVHATRNANMLSKEKIFYIDFLIGYEVSSI